jgi:hypothetical protein
MNQPTSLKPLLAASILGVASTLSGNVLWDGASNYIASGNVPFAGAFSDGAVLSHSGSLPYTLSNSILASPSYVGPAIYGGVYGYSEIAVAASGAVVGVARSESANPDIVRFQSPIGTATVAQVLNGALLFGTPTGTPLSGYSALSTDIRMALNATSGNYAVHWMVVGNDGISYVSQATTGALLADFASYQIDPSSTLWSVAAPDAQMALAGLDFSLGSAAIGNVTHAGIYLSANTTNHTFDLRSFTAVPEPTTYAALLGVLALGVVAWRRRR